MTSTEPVRIPQLRPYNKFPAEQLRANVQAALAAGKPDLHLLFDVENGHEAIVIAGGPSVDGQLTAIQRLRDAGHKVVAIERMQAWCWIHGIVPDYVVAVDASDDVAESLCQTNAKTIYLVASQAGAIPATTYTFTSPMADFGDLYRLFNAAPGQFHTIVNGGSSVGLTAMTLACALGMERVHVFGFDCHLSNGDYATGITGAGCPEINPRAVIVWDRTFVTTPSYFCFAQQFFQFTDVLEAQGFLKSVKVYGDSLVTAMAVDNIKGDS